MSFYLRLALRNLRSNYRIFIPFVLMTSILMVINMIMLNAYTSSNELFSEIGANAGGQMMGFGVITIIILSVILSLYANNFLHKQRTRQLGVYNAIGFGKRELSLMLIFEKLLMLIISIIIGGFLGLVMARGSYLALGRLLQLKQQLSFGLNIIAVIFSVIIISLIYILLFFIDEVWLLISRPINIIQAQYYGENEPRIKWLLLIFGVISLIIGYYLAISITDPMAVIGTFFIAVLLVIFATYALFISGSIFLLKALRHNKRYYYQPKHFINISNLLYRMKQNSVGLASITILLTMTLITITVTTTLFLGIEKINSSQRPVDLSFIMTSDESTTIKKVKQIAAANSVKVNKAQTLTSFETQGSIIGSKLDKEGQNSNSHSLRNIQFMTENAYQEYTRSKFMALNDNEVIVYSNKKFNHSKITIYNKVFKVKKNLRSFPHAKERGAWIPIFVVVFSNKSELIKTAKLMEPQRDSQSLLVTSQELQLEGSRSKQIMLSKELSRESSNLGIVNVLSKAQNYQDIIGIMGIFLFLGIILGTTFILTTLLILYYKQLSEGYADAKRYQIMQHVGLTTNEVRQTINSQMLTMFYLPLLVALIHVSVALPFTQRLLKVFGMNNWHFFLTNSLITFSIIAVIYVLAYKLTSNIYFKIVTERHASSR